jgi:hypothetical protein
MVRVPRPLPGIEPGLYLQEWVARGELDAALDLSVVEFDELAQLADIAVTAVETSAVGVAVHYTVSWTSFHACDDRTFGGKSARMLRGRAEGGEWVFERHERPPTRQDTLDEF